MFTDKFASSKHPYSAIIYNHYLLTTAHLSSDQFSCSFNCAFYSQTKQFHIKFVFYKVFSLNVNESQERYKLQINEIELIR